MTERSRKPLDRVPLDEAGWRRVAHQLGVEVPRSSQVTFRTEEDDWPPNDGRWPEGLRAEEAARSAIRRALGRHVVNRAQGQGQHTRAQIEATVRAELRRQVELASARFAALVAAEFDLEERAEQERAAEGDWKGAPNCVHSGRCRSPNPWDCCNDELLLVGKARVWHCHCGPCHGGDQALQIRILSLLHSGPRTVDEVVSALAGVSRPFDGGLRPEEEAQVEAVRSEVELLVSQGELIRSPMPGDDAHDLLERVRKGGAR